MRRRSRRVATATWRSRSTRGPCRASSPRISMGLPAEPRRDGATPGGQGHGPGKNPPHRGRLNLRETRDALAESHGLYGHLGHHGGGRASDRSGGNAGSHSDGHQLAGRGRLPRGEAAAARSARAAHPYAGSDGGSDLGRGGAEAGARGWLRRLRREADRQGDVPQRGRAVSRLAAGAAVSDRTTPTRAPLLATFLVELEEQVRTMNADLLALEAEPADAERLKSLFRVVHTLKGAARAIAVAPIEQACHALETLLAGAREGKRSLGPEEFALLCSAADALLEAGQRLQ